MCKIGNELWMEQACSQVDELAKLTNIKPEYITIDDPSFANKNLILIREQNSH